MDDTYSDSNEEIHEESSDIEDSDFVDSDFNQRNNYRISTYYFPNIIKAVAMDDIDRVRALLIQGNDVNVTDIMNNTALHISLNRNNMNIIDLLLSHPDVNLECRNSLGETPLMRSIRDSSDAVIMKFLEAGCDVNTQDSDGGNTLHVAFVSKQPSTIVEELLKRGVNLDAPCGCGFGATALFHAIGISSLKLVRMLLNYDADTSITDDNNITPFLYSIINKWVDWAIAYELLPYVVDFSLSNLEGVNCLSLAINNGHPIAEDIIQIIDYESLNQIDIEGNSALFFCTRHGNGKLFKELFSRIDHNILLKSHEPLLYSLLPTADIFGIPSWIECFYLFASSDIFAISMQKFLSYLNDRPLFVWILDKLSFEDVPQDDREKIIYIFLSYGVKVYFEDIIYYYNVFGPCEELNILTSFKIYGHQPFRCSPFLSYIFGREVRKSYTNLQRDLIKEAETRPFNILRFFTFDENFQCPSLLEICRNEIRFIIRNYFEITTTNEFYEAVERLDIPVEMKNVILFKTPLH